MASWTQLSNFPFTFPFSKNTETVVICFEWETWGSLREEARMSPAFVQHMLEEKQRRGDGEAG